MCLLVAFLIDVYLFENVNPTSSNFSLYYNYSTVASLDATLMTGALLEYKTEISH